MQLGAVLGDALVKKSSWKEFAAMLISRLIEKSFSTSNSSIAALSASVNADFSTVLIMRCRISSKVLLGKESSIRAEG